jgi:hypothetical protein
MTHQQPPSQPEIPAELWMLWIPRLGEWALSLEARKDGPTYLVAFSEPQAAAAAKHQNEHYVVTCHPVRVK